MILRIRNITEPDNIIMISNNQVINFSKEENGVVTEIAANKEYTIITNKSHIRIIHKIVLWLIFSIMELLGTKTEEYLTDAFSLNDRLYNVYASILCVNKCDTVVETLKVCMSF